MNDVSNMPPMVPSARDRIDAVYEQWNDVTDIHTDIEDLHIAAMERAYQDGFNAALLAQSPPPGDAVKLAEEYKGRADDAGRLSRLVLSTALADIVLESPGRLTAYSKACQERDGEREARYKCEAALRQKDEAMDVLFDRLKSAGVDVSDLFS